MEEMACLFIFIISLRDWEKNKNKNINAGQIIIFV